MNTQATSPGCPDLETISAYFDGELEADETVRSHFSACPDCARRLADYELIRRTVSRALSSEPDPGLNARIAAYVRAENAKLPPPAQTGRKDASDSRTAWIFRIAALFLLSAFFVYLLTDQLKTNRSRLEHTVTEAPGPAATTPRSGPLPVIEAAPGAGDYVRARLVSNTPSSRQYAIDVDPMLMPSDFDDIPGDGRIPLPMPSEPWNGGEGPKRIPLHGGATPDAQQMLESIRRDLTALNVPGVTVDMESRGKSLITTIHLDTDLDMHVMKTDGMFVFHLRSVIPDYDDTTVMFQIEFFCE